jgi:predicted PurR-regulated permease PerM
MSSPTRPHQTYNTDSVAVLAKWVRRCGLPFAILAWTGVALLILWLAGQVIQTLLLLALAAVLAYALVPAVTLLARVMPRFLAILVVYLVVLGLIGALVYLIVRTAIGQFISLADYVRFLLTPGTSGPFTPFDRAMQSVGISPSQIASARDQIVASLEGFVGGVVPLLTGLVGVLLDVILVAVLSIYLLVDGAPVAAWLRQNMPDQHQGRMHFCLIRCSGSSAATSAGRCCCAGCLG